MVRRAALFLLFLLGASAAPTGAARSSPLVADARFTPRDVFGLHWAEDVQISPDARRIAYTRVENDIRTDSRRRAVWLIDRGSRRECLLATDATTPRWSPDGSEIAFVAERGGKAQIRVLNLENGRDRTVATVDGGTSAPIWSPGGDFIAFSRFIARPDADYIAPVAKPADAMWAAAPHIITDFAYAQDGERFATPGTSRLFVVAAGGGEPTPITDGQTNVSGNPVWVDGGRALVFAGTIDELSSRNFFETRLYRVGRDGGTPVAVSPPNLAVNDVSASADGRSLVFIGRRPNGHDYAQGSVFLLTLHNRVVRQLAPGLDREAQQPLFSGDGSSVFISYGDHGHQVVGRLPLNGDATAVVGDVGNEGAYSLAHDDTVAFATVAATRPADVAVQPTGTREPRRLTDLNAALLAGKALAEAQPIEFRSPSDGTSIGAWLVTAPGKSVRRPLILDIHGGPHGFDDPEWKTQDQLLAAAGYAVLHVNYRGSLSYGSAFADRIARDFPGPAFDDLMGGVDAAIAGGFADPDRLFVTGGSSGGELTAWIVGRTDRFKAALAVKPVINAASEALTTEQYGYARITYGALPWEDYKTYWARSPLSGVGRVTTPTLLMVGELDHNTAPGEAEQFYAALRLRGVETALVIVPDAGHASIAGTPSRQIAGASIMLDWFGRHGGATVAPAILTH